MSIKFSNTSTPNTRILLAYDAAVTDFPNSDWTLAFAVKWDGNTTSTDNSQVFATGQTTGSFSMVARPDNRILVCFVDGTATGRAAQPAGMVPGQSYIMLAERRSNVLRTKLCPVLTTNPNDGSAVITSTNTFALTKSLTGSDLRIGERTSDRRWDNSTERGFFMHGVLTDLEIAKLAYGMDIYEIGKTPKWYVRMFNGTDTADFGPNALNTTRSPDPMVTGASIGFGYVSVNSPPTVTQPSIPGSPQVGTLVTATSGTVGGFPNPTNTWQWLRNGVAISGATNQGYIPVAEDVGTNTLSVRQTVTSSQGTANATSAPVSVAASANAIYLVPPTAERIFQRANGVATIPFSGTYSGEQPSSIQYQLYDPDGTTVRQAWSSIGANIVAGGTWSASPTIPQGGKKYRIAVREMNSGGSVIATSAIHESRFGVGDLIIMVGSSTAQTWSRQTTGSADNDIYSTFSVNGWSVRPERTLSSKMAARFTAQSGVVVAMGAFGIGGTNLAGSTGWLNTSYVNWTNFVAGLQAAGGKFAGLFVAVGSNDAGGGAISSRAVWLASIQQFITNIRTNVGQPNLPVLWSGLNQRTTGNLAAQPEVFDANCNLIRMAEIDAMLAEPTRFVVSPSLDLELSSDGVHLSDAGYDAQTDRIGYVWPEFVAGRLPRGPRVTAMVYQGNRIRLNLQHANGTDLATFVNPTGFAAYASDGTALTFTVEKFSSTAIDLVCSANVTRATYMAGRNPNNTRTIYDNGSTPLPMFPETDMAATSGTLIAEPPADTTAPVLTGSVSVSNVTTTGAVLTWAQATDNVAVTGYEYSINGGTSYINSGSARTVTLTSLTPSTTYQLRARAYDEAGNRSAPVSGTLVTSDEVGVPPQDVTAPSISGAITSSGITSSTGTISWPIATDNFAVTGYEYSINAGLSYVNVGTARTASLAMLSANTLYQLRVRAYDAAGNRSTPISGSFTTASGTVDPVNFVTSASRTVRILAGQRAYDVGSFWTASGNNSPVGSKDPNSTIDIHFDWTAWLADIGNAQLSAVDFILSSGIESMAGIPTDVGGTVFISGGTISQNVTITCRITTATIPARVEDRTVVLQIKEQ